MGDRAPRSLCLGGELLIPLRGAASRSPTVDQHQAPLGSNKLYLNSLLNGLAYYLRLPSPPPSTGGPPCTGPPLWTTLILPLTQLLTLRNSRTGEEVACQVVYVSPHESEKRQVGVDFMKPCPRFWRIPFPPPDWTTQSPEAKGSPRRPASTPQNSKQKK